MGSEDFASYSYEVPSLYIILGAGAKNENEEFGVPMHNSKVVFNEDILPTGSSYTCSQCYNMVKKQQVGI